jgi:hypothetical protein
MGAGFEIILLGALLVEYNQRLETALPIILIVPGEKLYTGRTFSLDVKNS